MVVDWRAPSLVSLLTSLEIFDYDPPVRITLRFQFGRYPHIVLRAKKIKGDIRCIYTCTTFITVTVMSLQHI